MFAQHHSIFIPLLVDLDIAPISDLVSIPPKVSHPPYLHLSSRPKSDARFFQTLQRSKALVGSIQSLLGLEIERVFINQLDITDLDIFQLAIVEQAPNGLGARVAVCSIESVQYRFHQGYRKTHVGIPLFGLGILTQFINNINNTYMTFVA